MKNTVFWVTLISVLVLILALGCPDGKENGDNEDGFSISIDSLEHGSITPNVTIADAGELINLTINPDPGYSLTPSTLKYNGIAINEETRRFIMPAENVIITAAFSIQPYTITVLHPYGGGTFTVSVAGGAAIQSNTSALFGQVITLTANPAENFFFDSFTVTRQDDSTEELEGTGFTRTFSMPSSRITVTASFRDFPKTGDLIPGKGSLIFHDEFDGTELDTTKWDLAPEWDRQDRSSWRDEMVSVGGGNLIIRMRRDSALGDQRLPANAENRQQRVDNWLRSGGIRSRKKSGEIIFENSYGYYEARILFPSPYRGTWGAFWLMTRTGSGGMGNGTEIDIVESINNETGRFNSAIHWDGYGSNHKMLSSGNSPRQPLDVYDGEYHIYALRWSPESYIFYVDGIEYWRLTAGQQVTYGGNAGSGTTTVAINQNPNYIKLSMEGANWAGQLPVGWDGTAEMLVDYVRVYKLEGDN